MAISVYPEYNPLRASIVNVPNYGASFNDNLQSGVNSGLALRGIPQQIAQNQADAGQLENALRAGTLQPQITQQTEAAKQAAGTTPAVVAKGTLGATEANAAVPGAPAAVQAAQKAATEAAINETLKAQGQQGGAFDTAKAMQDFERIKAQKLAEYFSSGALGGGNVANDVYDNKGNVISRVRVNPFNPTEQVNIPLPKNEKVDLPNGQLGTFPSEGAAVVTPVTQGENLPGGTPGAPVYTDKAGTAPDILKTAKDSKAYKDYQSAASAYKSIQTAIQQANKSKSLIATDRIIIDFFNQEVNKNAVVRPGTYALTAAEQGVLNHYKGVWDQGVRGGFGLTPQDRGAFESAMSKIYAKERDNALADVGPAIDQATKLGIPVKESIPRDLYWEHAKVAGPIDLSTLSPDDQAAFKSTLHLGDKVYWKGQPIVYTGK